METGNYRGKPYQPAVILTFKAKGQGDLHMVGTAFNNKKGLYSDLYCPSGMSAEDAMVWVADEQNRLAEMFAAPKIPSNGYTQSLEDHINGLPF